MSSAQQSAAEPARTSIEAVGLAALLLTAASGRLLAPAYVRNLIPRWIPRPRLVADLTGVAELVLAGALLHPTSRQRAALATTGLISAYLVSHLDAAVRASRQQPRWLDRPAGATVRLSVNAAYIAWSAHLAATTSAGSTSRHDDEPIRTRSQRRKYRLLRVALRPGNTIARAALRRGLGPGAFALLETRGRRSGLPRHTVVGNGLDGDTFWLIAAHGERADFVANITADPGVRVLVAGRWRDGLAAALPHDDVAQRSRLLPYPWDARIGRALATTPLTVRIDLTPANTQPTATSHRAGTRRAGERP